MLLFHVGLHFPRLLFKERKWEWNFNCQSEISTNTYTVITALHSSCSFACCHRPCPQEDIFPGLYLKTQFPNRKSSMNCKWSFSLGMSPASTVMIIETSPETAEPARSSNQVGVDTFSVVFDLSASRIDVQIETHTSLSWLCILMSSQPQGTPQALACIYMISVLRQRAAVLLWLLQACYLLSLSVDVSIIFLNCSCFLIVWCHTVFPWAVLYGLMWQSCSSGLFSYTGWLWDKLVQGTAAMLQVSLVYGQVRSGQLSLRLLELLTSTERTMLVEGVLFHVLLETEKKWSQLVLSE